MWHINYLQYPSVYAIDNSKHVLLPYYTKHKRMSVCPTQPTSRIRQRKKLIAAKPIICPRNSMDGDSDNCNKIITDE